LIRRWFCLCGCGAYTGGIEGDELVLKVVGGGHVGNCDFEANGDDDGTDFLKLKPDAFAVSDLDDLRTNHGNSLSAGSAASGVP
jgi:hypothetical protein